MNIIDAILGTNHEDDWQHKAICSQTDPEAFFVEKGGTTKPAKKICLGCPVRQECLDYALKHDERWGVWGGYSERERRRLQRGEVFAPTMNRGGYRPPVEHTPSSACYQRGCRKPECCEAKATYEREHRKKQRDKGTAA